MIIKKIYRYLHTLTDFYKLNKYVFYSTNFFTNLEKTLYSDLENDLKINIITGLYSDFKADMNFDDFYIGVPVSKVNKFDNL